MTTDSIAVPALPIPSAQYEQENEAQFRRQIERSFLDVTAYVERVLAGLSVASHVLADEDELGAEHTISGASAGDVLRASGAAAAQFTPLFWSDLTGKCIVSSADINLTSSTTNNLATGTATFLRLNEDIGGAVELTGFAGGVAGRILVLTVYQSGRQVNIRHENGSSDAANRVIIPSTSTFQMFVGLTAILIYDGSSSRWRMISALA